MRKILVLVLVVLGGFTISMQSFGKTWYYNDYTKYAKVIKVNTFANILSYYEYGEKIGEMPTSAGDKKNYTPEGRFRIINKHDFMYSKSAGKFMPFWMEFWKGKYGIHALAEDSAGNLNTSSVIGEAAPGGCVRLNSTNAETLYNWAEIGTPVFIAYDKSEFANPEKDKETINTYYTLINAGKYQEALLMKTIKPDSLQLFIDTYHGLTIHVDSISQITGGEYIVKLTYTKEKRISQVKANFSISKGKIIRSFIMK
ncbi:MAG: L,D-transpeptidase [Candidatus Absconditabacteria bacterium]